MLEFGPIHKIKDFATVEAGLTPSRARSDFFCVESGVPWVKTGDLNNGLVYNTEEHLTEKALDETSIKIRNSGSILIAMYGGLKQIGRTGLLAVDAATNQAISCVSLDRTRADPEYVLHFLNASKGRWEAIAASSRKDPNITRKDVEDFRIPLPPLPEQRRIAAILRTWDEAIDAASRLIDAKRRRLDGAAARIFAATRAIGGGRRPEGWTRMTFGDAFTERKTRNPGLLDSDVVTVGKYAIRKQSEHFKRSVASKELSPYWVISPGDFVYDPMSAYYGALGRFDGESDGIVSPAYRVIRLAKGLDSDFMVELLKQQHVRFQLDALSSQGNKEGKRRSLQRSAFDSVEFFAPGQNAQREMAGKVALFRQDLAVTERHLDALKRQKRGLMQKLLTGEWRVPEGGSG